jgi:hypothetical protein
VPHHSTTENDHELDDLDDVAEPLAADDPGATCEGGLIRLGAPDTIAEPDDAAARR